MFKSELSKNENHYIPLVITMNMFLCNSDPRSCGYVNSDTIDLGLPIFTPPNITPQVDQVNSEARTKIDLENNLGADYIPSNGKFRLQNNRLMLTYKSKIPKAAYKEWFKTLYATKKLEMAHETGLSSGLPYDHTHVLIDFGVMIQTTNCRKFDYQGIHPNIKKVLTTAHWIHCQNYLAKEDPENAHLKTEPSIVDVVWGQDDLENALRKTVKKASDVTGIIQLYNLKPEMKPYRCAKPTFAWCDDAIAIAESTTVDYRNIHWYVDYLGGTGKTWLVKYLVSNNPKRYFFVNQVGGLYHFSNNVAKAIKSGWNQEVILFNLSKDNQDKQIYEPLEAAKDGLMTSCKYEGGSFIYECPIVIVFANFAPKVDRLANKRFIVKQILPDHSSRLIYDMSQGINLLSEVAAEEAHQETQLTRTDTLLTIVGDSVKNETSL